MSYLKRVERDRPRNRAVERARKRGRALASLSGEANRLSRVSDAADLRYPAEWRSGTGWTCLHCQQTIQQPVSGGAVSSQLHTRTTCKGLVGATV